MALEIKKVTVPSPVQQQIQMYEIPVYQKLKAKDGKEVEVQVNSYRVSKDQLEKAIADAQEKLNAIIELEAKEQPKVEQQEG